MATLQEKLIETLEIDFIQIQECKDSKGIRKQCSLLDVRIKSARKLFSEDSIMLKQLDSLQDKIKKLADSSR